MSAGRGHPVRPRPRSTPRPRPAFVLCLCFIPCRAPPWLGRPRVQFASSGPASMSHRPACAARPDQSRAEGEGKGSEVKGRNAIRSATWIFSLELCRLDGTEIKGLNSSAQTWTSWGVESVICTGPPAESVITFSSHVRCRYHVRTV